MTTPDKNYINFLEEYEKFKNTQDQQKKRGLNDYNILTTVLKAHDEVRLHSRMIASLLNTQAQHYQGSLFLDLFLKCIKFNDFLNLRGDQIITKREHENIDIYITDNSKHIIIENKIYAGDQKTQIERYIKEIRKAEVLSSDILVIYLSIEARDPSQNSLGNFSIRNDKIFENDKEIALYKNITYKNDVLNWLNTCRNEVRNITNLNEVFKQYIQVVQKITKLFKGKIMSLDKIFMDDTKNYTLASEIAKELPNIKSSITHEFFSMAITSLRGKLNSDWEINLTKHDLSKKYGFPLRIYKTEWKEKKHLLFGFEFNKDNYREGRFGLIRCNEKIDITNVSKKFEKDFENISLSHPEKWNTSPWWIFKHPISQNPNEDFVEYIFSKSKDGKLNCDEFIAHIMVYIKLIELDNGLVTKINSDLNQ